MSGQPQNNIIFDVEELRKAKRKHPNWVFFLGDQEKSPQKIVGKWKQKTTQTPEELEELIKETQNGNVEAWNWGIKTGLGIVALDWDWEFLAYDFCRYFKERAKTEIYRTANKGYRMLYETTEKENASPYKKTLHMEVENMGYAILGGYAIDTEGKKEEYKKETEYPIKEDNTIIADVKAFLAEQLKRYDFLSYNCINATVNRKHIKLEHTQRLAILQFMLSKDFPDEEIHAFFMAVYNAEGKRDYAKEKTQAQIDNGRAFKERGGKTHPCTAKTNAETGHISIPLYQVFTFDAENCKGCLRKKSITKTERQEAKEQEIAEILAELHTQFTFKTPEDMKDLYYYDDGVYKPAESKIEKLLEDKLGAKGYTYLIDEIIKHLKRGSYCERAEFNKFQGLIPVQNGLLDLNTGTVGPFDKDKIFTYKLNVTYDADKKYPKFLKAINEWVEAPNIPILQEITGYCLLPAMPFHKLFFLHGTGFNGKGSYIATLIALLGRQNCVNLGLEEFDGSHRFSTALLYGKMINVSSEPSTERQLQTPLLKKLCGEDEIDAEVKNKQNRVHFMNTAKQFVLGNRYPRVNDNTTAFWERAIFIQFPFNYIGDKQIPQIWKTWTEDPDEMSGILNWAIEGLHRLNKNNQFTKSKNTEETKLDFQKASDTTLAFLNESCIVDKEAENIKADFYDLYKSYCEENGLEIESLGMFAAKLKQQPHVRSVRKRIEKKLEWLWAGVRLMTDEEKEAKNEQKTLDDTVPPVPPVPPFSNSKQNKGKEKNLGKNKEMGGTLGTGGTLLRADGKLEEALGHKPNTQGLIQCQECKARGKQSVFATDADLAAHMKAYHEAS